jgi:hypothetical protein
MLAFQGSGSTPFTLLAVGFRVCFPLPAVVSMCNLERIVRLLYRAGDWRLASGAGFCHQIGFGITTYQNPATSMLVRVCCLHGRSGDKVPW